MKNSMENLHTDVKVYRVKNIHEQACKETNEQQRKLQTGSGLILTIVYFSNTLR